MPRVSQAYEQNQKKRIMEGAAKVFAEYGYRQTTMDQISKSLELSKGAIYLYFRSKEELYLSTMEFIFNERFVLLSNAFAENDPFPVKAEKLFSRLGNLANNDNNGAFTRLSVEGFLESDRIQGLQAIKVSYYNRFYKLLYDFLIQGQATGVINPKIDTSGLVVVMIASLDGLMMHSLVENREFDPKRIREAVFRMFSQSLNFSVNS